MQEKEVQQIASFSIGEDKVLQLVRIENSFQNELVTITTGQEDETVAATNQRFPYSMDGLALAVKEFFEVANKEFCISEFDLDGDLATKEDEEEASLPS